MTSKIDVVIDIETLGTAVDAKIIGIGAVAVVDNVLPYVPTGGSHYGKIYDKVFFHVSVNGGCKINQVRSDTESTKDFWAEQDKGLQNLYQPANSFCGLHTALQLLERWIKSVQVSQGGELRPWGNGSVFDISILEHAFLQCDIQIPWDFWNIRDVRTRIEDAQLDKKSIPFEGTKHYALDDAYHEAKLIVAAQHTLDRGAYLLSLNEVKTDD